VDWCARREIGPTLAAWATKTAFLSTDREVYIYERRPAEAGTPTLPRARVSPERGELDNTEALPVENGSEPKTRRSSSATSAEGRKELSLELGAQSTTVLIP
jgi:hypothetical protein